MSSNEEEPHGTDAPVRVSGTKRALKSVLTPRALVTLIVGGGVLVALVLSAGPQQALQLITHVHPGALVAFFLLMAGYEVVRCAQWHYMLTRLNITVPLRTQIFAYAIGELTKNVPVGNFVPAYVLTREEGTDFGRASSSSLLISVLEVAVALTGIVIIGIDDWTCIRPLILIGSFLFGLLVWALYRWFHHSQHTEHMGQAGASPPIHVRRVPPRWARRVLRWRWVRKAMEELREFTRGEAILLHPDVIAVSTLACAAYMICSGFALYAVVIGLGLGGLSWEEALAASFFSLAVSTIIPVPTDLGTSEASGAGALVAMGLTVTGAVSALLLYRFLNLVEQILVAALACVVFPAEFRGMLHSRPREAAQSE
jgi:uncharacterized protein (TIRG00374 family)